MYMKYYVHINNIHELIFENEHFIIKQRICGLPIIHKKDPFFTSRVMYNTS